MLFLLLLGEFSEDPSQQENSWANFVVDVPMGANYLSFDLGFDSESTGNLYVAINDQPVAQFAEEFTPGNFETGRVYFETLTPGEHVLSFLLVPAGGAPSVARIENVRLGLSSTDAIQVETLTALRSAISSGGKKNLHESDDNYLHLTTGFPSVGNRPKADAEVVASVISDSRFDGKIENVTEIQFLIESKASSIGPDISDQSLFRSIEIFDFTESEYVCMGSFAESPGDSYASVLDITNPTRFIEPLQRQNSESQSKLASTKRIQR